MATPEHVIRQKTVDALAKGLFEEASKYGLQQPEIIRFVNTLLQLSMQDNEAAKTTPLPLATKTPARNEHPLVSKELSIRPCCAEQDKKLIQTWLEDPDGQDFLRHRLTARSISIEQLLDEKEHRLGIIMLAENSGLHTPVGCVAFLDYDRQQQKAELRKLIGAPEMRGRGFAKRATRLWINYGLQELGLKKIYLNTLSNNIRNIRINEDLGFSVEGILRNEVFLEGKHHDIIRMGLCSG